jgi:cytochrome b
VLGLLATAYGKNMLTWHVWLARLTLALIGFRVLWGLVGGRWSRFSSFIYAPRTVLNYLQNRPTPGVQTEVGHSPLGALSVFALLAALALQLYTGMVIDDEIAFTGPLNRFVSLETVKWASSWHRSWGGWIVIGLIVLHFLAIQVYIARRNNLLTPMIEGDKWLPAGTPASKDGGKQRVRALLLAVLCMWLAVLIFRL